MTQRVGDVFIAWHIVSEISDDCDERDGDLIAQAVKVFLLLCFF